MKTEKTDPARYILSYLKRNTDEHHVATRQEIVDYVQNAIDVSLSEKSFARIMRKLQESDNVSGYDRVKGGYYVAQRDFSEAEAFYLCGMLESLPRLGQSEKTGLFNKIASTQSCHVERHLRAFAFHHATSPIKIPVDVLANIALLRKAIGQERVISYMPISFDCESCKYIVQPTPKKCEPRFLLFVEGRPWLLATDHEGNEAPCLFHLAVDMMAHIIVSDIPSPAISHAIASEAAGYGNRMEGRVEEAVIKCSKDLADVVSHMNINARNRPCDKEHFLLEITASKERILRFALQYAGKVEILKPSPLRNELLELLAKAAETYN